MNFLPDYRVFRESVVSNFHGAYGSKGRKETNPLKCNRDCAAMWTTVSVNRKNAG